VDLGLDGGDRDHAHRQDLAAHERIDQGGLTALELAEDGDVEATRLEAFAESPRSRHKIWCQIGGRVRQARTQSLPARSARSSW
jgi:hypothetical protein